MIWVTDARPLEGHRLWVRFNDAAEGEIDLSDLIFADTRPIVAALRDPAVFAALRVDMDTVVWNNGFDLAPEYLRSRVKSAATA
jgi:Protein of unknown function (DUF2442)